MGKKSIVTAPARTSEHAEQLDRTEELAGIGSWEWNIATGQISWSTQFYKIVGWDPAEGTPSYEASFDVVHPDDRAAAKARIEAAIAHGEDFEATYRVVRGDGSTRVVRGCGRVESEGGKPVRIYGVAQDVTEQKSSEDRLRNILQATPDPIVIADKQGFIQFANNQIEDLLGFNPNELIGAPVESLIPSNLRSKHREHRRSYADDPHPRAMGEGRNLVALHKNGSRVPVEVSLSPVDLDGETVVLAALRDVTARREQEDAMQASEARLRAIVEQSMDAVIVLTGDGAIEEWNPAAESLFGIERADAINASFEGLILPGAVVPRFRSLVRRVLGGANEVWEAALRRPDGSEAPTEVAAGVMKTPDGPRILATCRDLAERRRSEQADRLAFERLLEIEQLKEVNRMKTTLLNTASHELKTPMTPLRLQLHLLSTGALGPLTDKQKHSVTVLSRNAERLSDLISDVLDVARMESGHLNLAPKPTDMHLLAEEATEMFQEAAAAAGKTIAVDVPEIRITADPNRVLQVLINLVSNALKFTKEGGSIKIHGKAENGIHIEVTDDGIGLTPKQVSQLFEPFSQVHDRAQVDVAGTGLGLYICKAIVEEHGGSMGVTSAGPGKGATFWFKLLPEPPVEPEEGEGE